MHLNTIRKNTEKVKLKYRKTREKFQLDRKPEKPDRKIKKVKDETLTDPSSLGS